MMKKLKRISIAIFIIGLLQQCFSEKPAQNSAYKACYIEKTLSFFNPYENTYSNRKHVGYTYETWIRKPENMKMVHETFKKIGYENLISEFQLKSNPCLLWGYRKRPLNQMIDSLVITFQLDTIESKFYREFWGRRAAEDNESMVFNILKEVSAILNEGKEIGFDSSAVNDTLYRLVQIDKIVGPRSKSLAFQHFNYLKEIGMHASAYNLLFENFRYENIDWDKEALKNGLIKSDSIFCSNPWVQDNVK